MRSRVLSDALKTQQDLNTRRKACDSVNTWRKTMGSRITRYAAIAVIVFAILVGIKLTGRSINVTSVAWSQVVEQINSHTRYRSRQRLVPEQGPPLPARVIYRLNLSQRRQELEDGSIHVIDMRGPDTITLELYPAKKEAFVNLGLGAGPKEDPDIIDKVKRFDQASTERLGTKSKDGKTLHGFRNVPDKYQDYTVWVDADSRLPVEIKIKRPTRKQTLFIDEFEFDFKLDAKAFSTEVPEGYEVDTAVLDYRPFEPKVVSIEALRNELSTAYDLGSLPWMETLTLMQVTNPLVKRGKVFVGGIQTDDDNCLVIVQTNHSTERRLPWLAKETPVLQTPGKRRVFAHPNGSEYARSFLESISKVSPDLFDMKNLSEQRMTRMVVMPNGVVLGVCANQPLAEDRLLGLVESLTEIKAP